MTDRIYYSKSAENLAKRRQASLILAFLALGVGIGAALALLFAPEEGKRTRELIADALEDGFNRGLEATKGALRQLEKEYPGVRERVENALGNIMK